MSKNKAKKHNAQNSQPKIEEKVIENVQNEAKKEEVYILQLAAARIEKHMSCVERYALIRSVGTAGIGHSPEVCYI